MARVVKREGESAEMLMKRFKKQVLLDNILGECKKRQHFMSNSEKRRYKAEEAKKRAKNKKLKIKFSID